MAVGTSEKRIIYDENAPNKMRMASIMSVSLSGDHRVIDGALGAKWLEQFRQYCESPILMLL